MSTQIDNGGPAFPLQDWDPVIQSRRSESGMSLRDWFAGQALAGAMTQQLAEDEATANAQIRQRVVDSLFAADTMILARKLP